MEIDTTTIYVLNTCVNKFNQSDNTIFGSYGNQSTGLQCKLNDCFQSVKLTVRVNSGLLSLLQVSSSTCHYMKNEIFYLSSYSKEIQQKTDFFLRRTELELETHSGQCSDHHCTKNEVDHQGLYPPNSERALTSMTCVQIGSIHIDGFKNVKKIQNGTLLPC